MNTATEPQMNFIKSLKEQRDTTSKEAVFALDTCQRLWDLGCFDKQAASALIDVLKSQPRLETGSGKITTPAPEGMHLLDGVIYKVQRAIYGSGNLYAKRLVQDGDDWAFEYAPGIVKQLSEDTRMTLDEAKAFGALYGTCCVCGRTLTNEASIEAGIGPICAGRF